LSPPLAIVGVNHRTASGALRERLAAEEAETPLILARLRTLGLDDALWLSTCDRTEIWLGRTDAPIIETVFDFLSERAGTPAEDLEAEAVNLRGPAALRHIFAVAASLDSRIVGEPHILGQLKAAHRAAADVGLVGPGLDGALQAAYAAAKRARSETALAEGATSIVAAAVQVARDLHGDLDRCAGLLLGGGDMGAMILEGLQGAGLGRLAVAAPQERRALAAARRFGGRALSWDEAGSALADADLVIAACGFGRCVVEAAMVEAALKKRRRRPIFFIDAAVPADVDPAVGRIDEAYLYDLGDLEGVALAGRAGRDAAQRAAWTLVDEAAAAFIRDRAERGAAPLVTALRAHFEAERRRVLDEHPEMDADGATRLLINRLLHQPSEALRAAAAGATDGAGVEQAATKLFGLGGAQFSN
jgi:glutamyl-tRNA reductase